MTALQLSFKLEFNISLGWYLSIHLVLNNALLTHNESQLGSDAVVIHCIHRLPSNERQRCLFPVMIVKETEMIYMLKNISKAHRTIG